MVQITPEEVMEQRRLQKRVEEMSDMDKDICGAREAKHVILPMGDVYNLRRYSVFLRDLAAELEMLSKRRDYAPRSIILEARASIDACNQRVREVNKPSGKRKRWNVEGY